MANMKETELNEGLRLEEAIKAFYYDLEIGHYEEVIRVISDSYVWIPCTAVMSDADNKSIEDLIKKHSENPEELVGKSFGANDEIRLIPDILQKGDDLFFPVFSSVEAMGEYGNGFSKIQKHMLDVITLASNNEKKLSGIVINAFTEPFVLKEMAYDSVFIKAGKAFPSK